MFCETLIVAHRSWRCGGSRAAGSPSVVLVSPPIGLFAPRRSTAIAVRGTVSGRGGLSVNPGHGYPLRGHIHSFDRFFQLSDCFFDVIVHYGQVKEMAVRLLEQVRLLCQPF